MIEKRTPRAALAAALFLIACGPPAEENAEPLVRSVRTVTVSAGGGALQRTFSGEVQSGEQSRLSFRVSGRVTAVAVNVGDEVEEGDLLAEIDDADLQLQVAEASSSVAQARAQLTQARNEYRRVQTLYEAGSASAADLDAARAARDSAQGSVSSLGSRVGLARRQLGYARLTAPADGRVLSVEVEASELVQVGQTVVVLQSGTQLEVRVAVPEVVINRVEPNADVSIHLPTMADGTDFEGRVFEVGAAMESATFPVTIRFTGDTERVRSGMAAEVTFLFEETEESRARLRVPGIAVGEDRRGRFVYRVEPTSGDRAKVRRTRVEVGELTPEGLEILDGLEEGMVIVTAGVSRLTDNQDVRLPRETGDESEGSPESSPDTGDGDGDGDGEASDEATP